jgi:hypothetical protein
VPRDGDTPRPGSKRGDDFEDQVTPGRGGTPVPSLVIDPPSGLTDSQRDWFAKRLASQVPVVKPSPTPSPYGLLSRTTTHDELEILRHFRLGGDQVALAEFVVKLFGELRNVRRDLNEKIESDSSANERDMEALRSLLSKPPNGRVQALQDRIEKLEDASRDADRDAEHRLKRLEGDASFAKRTAQAVIVFLILAIGGAGVWLGIREERLGNVIDAVKELERHSRWHNAKDPSP